MFYPISEIDAPLDDYELTDESKRFLLDDAYENKVVLDKESDLYKYAKEIKHPCLQYQ